MTKILKIIVTILLILKELLEEVNLIIAELDSHRFNPMVPGEPYTYYYQLIGWMLGLGITSLAIYFIWNQKIEARDYIDLTD